MKFLFVSLVLISVATAIEYQPHPQPHIAILKQAQHSSPEGSYQYHYETENGIAASEHGQPQPLGPHGEHVVTAQGQYHYTSPDGTLISVSYTADENGFHPEGDHLPVPPPVPDQIQKAINYIIAHPQPEHQQ